MLKRIQLFPLNFYKKEKFDGSMGKMNFRLAKAVRVLEPEEGEEEGKKEDYLLGTVWEGPYCYDVTDKKNFVTKEYPFAEEGIQAAMEWFNEESKSYNE